MTVNTISAKKEKNIFFGKTSKEAMELAKSYPAEAIEHAEKMLKKLKLLGHADNSWRVKQWTQVLAVAEGKPMPKAKKAVKVAGKASDSVQAQIDALAQGQAQLTELLGKLIAQM